MSHKKEYFKGTQQKSMMELFEDKVKYWAKLSLVTCVESADDLRKENKYGQWSCCNIQSGVEIFTDKWKREFKWDIDNIQKKKQKGDKIDQNFDCRILQKKKEKKRELKWINRCNN